MDELLGRKTPHSAPAEQAAIGSMLIDARCIPEVLEKLKPDEFYIQLNRDIYETIYAMFSYSISVDFLLHELTVCIEKPLWAAQRLFVVFKVQIINHEIIIKKPVRMVVRVADGIHVTISSLACIVL